MNLYVRTFWLFLLIWENCSRVKFPFTFKWLGIHIVGLNGPCLILVAGFICLPTWFGLLLLNLSAKCSWTLLGAFVSCIYAAISYWYGSFKISEMPFIIQPHAWLVFESSPFNYHLKREILLPFFFFTCKILDIFTFLMFWPVAMIGSCVAFDIFLLCFLRGRNWSKGICNSSRWNSNVVKLWKHMLQHLPNLKCAILCVSICYFLTLAHTHEHMEFNALSFFIVSSLILLFE